jgi:hypothetical protein
MDKVLKGDIVDVDEDFVSQLYGDIDHGKMLYKEQAKWLEKYLDDEYRFLAEHTYIEGSSYILHIDSLSIYADAWAMYCRPGTYMIVQ